MGRVVEHPRRGWIAFICVVTGVGCGDAVTPLDLNEPVVRPEESRSPDSLVAHDRWQLLSPSQDPFWQDGADSIPCEVQDLEFNSDGVEVNTRYCNHATLVQATRRAVGTGDAVHQELWWQPLASTTNATAHLRLRLGSTPLFEEDLPIPGPADVRHVQSTSSATYAVGTPVYFHVSNHGINSYTLHLLGVEPHSIARQTE